jgi:hypothetical protein
MQIRKNLRHISYNINILAITLWFRIQIIRLTNDLIKFSKNVEKETHFLNCAKWRNHLTQLKRSIRFQVLLHDNISFWVICGVSNNYISNKLYSSFWQYTYCPIPPIIKRRKSQRERLTGVSTTSLLLDEEKCYLIQVFYRTGEQS